MSARRATRPSNRSNTPDTSSSKPPERTPHTERHRRRDDHQGTDGGDEIGPNVQADEDEGEWIDQFPEAIAHALGDYVHGRGKVAERGKSLNRASTWRAGVETAPAARPTPARWRPRRGPRGSRGAARRPAPADQSVPHRNAATRAAPPGSPPGPRRRRAAEPR